MKHYIDYFIVGVLLACLISLAGAQTICPWGPETPSTFGPQAGISFNCTTAGTSSDGIQANEFYSFENTGCMVSMEGYKFTLLGLGPISYAKATEISSQGNGTDLITSKATELGYGRLVSSEGYSSNACVGNTSCAAEQGIMPYCLGVNGGTELDISKGQGASSLSLSTLAERMPSPIQIGYTSVSTGIGDVTTYGGFHSIRAESNETLVTGLTQNWYDTSTTYHGMFEMAHEFNFG